MVHVEKTAETAALLVTATVPKWREFKLGTAVSAARLESELQTRAEASGVDVSQPFPFLVRGLLRNVSWHVADGTRVEPGTPPDQDAQQGTVAEGVGTIVGFYSTQHQGVFTMMGQNMHMHVAMADESIAGHVRSVDFAADAVLSLPR